MTDRRRFLEVLTAGTAAAFLEACDSLGPRKARGLLKFAERKNESLERWLFHRGSRDRAKRDAPLAGKAFPKYFVSDDMPMWDPAIRGAWTLEVNGAVRKPLRLSLDALTQLPRVTQRVNHYCVEGWMARAEWSGTPLHEIARLVEPTPDAQYVDFQSFDSDYHESWDIDSALHAQTLIAYGMDGQLLGAGHGAPARVHSPVKLGYKNTKYLTRIVFMPARNGGYWSDRGYEWYGGV
jgi:DMSO/TMAO reductase YedYZ molybdopterin-dependent catalytic subunit